MITVTTTADELNNDSDCALREAIEAANTDAAVDACPAGESGVEDTVVIPAGTYTLSIAGTGESGNATGDLDLVGTLSLVGDGSATTFIDANGIDRVIHIFATGTVSISDITIRGGGGVNYGGGIRNAGDLTLTRVVVAENTATDEGGGLETGGAVTMVDCLVRDNEVTGDNFAEGGGLFVRSGSASIIGSTFTRNSVTSSPALVGQANGGGLGCAFGDLDIRSSTVTGNTATLPAGVDGLGGGGVYLFRCAGSSIQASTITDNTADDGAGIYVVDDAPRLRSTIVAQNNGADIGGSVVDDRGFNFIGGDPLLLPLADNGGPTPTHALDDDSPAIDAGACDDVDGNVIATDQRGEGRPDFGGCDVGAFELQGPEKPLIDVTPEPAGGNCPAGGQRIDAGTDVDSDGVLDPGEIETTAYICNGEGGTDGKDGTDGEDGTDSLIATSTEPPGENCPAGGVRIDVGSDTDRDGSLDTEEIEATNYVCNGDHGLSVGGGGGGCAASGSSAGATWLVALFLTTVIALRRRGQRGRQQVNRA